MCLTERGYMAGVASGDNSVTRLLPVTTISRFW